MIDLKRQYTSDPTLENQLAYVSQLFKEGKISSNYFEVFERLYIKKYRSFERLLRSFQSEELIDFALDSIEKAATFYDSCPIYYHRKLEAYVAQPYDENYYRKAIERETYTGYHGPMIAAVWYFNDCLKKLSQGIFSLDHENFSYNYTRMSNATLACRHTYEGISSKKEKRRRAAMRAMYHCMTAFYVDLQGDKYYLQKKSDLYLPAIRSGIKDCSIALEISGEKLLLDYLVNLGEKNV